MGGGMTPDVIAAATNMINNLNPMAVLQVSRMMTVVITFLIKMMTRMMELPTMTKT